MKTFEELKYRFESIASAMSKKGMIVSDKFCLEPPVSETTLCQYEKKWSRKLPDEMRKFFLEVAGKIVFEWYDCDVDDNSVLLDGPLKNISYEFDPVHRWPYAGGFKWSLEQMDWLYERCWPQAEEVFNDDVECYGPRSPYDYLYSYPFIYGEGGELFVFYAPPSGERLVFHYGDTSLGYWHKVADTFEEFWNNWTLLGCPHFSSYECFYNKKSRKLDPFCKDGVTWRRVLEIEHLENGKLESSPAPGPIILTKIKYFRGFEEAD